MQVMAKFPLQEDTVCKSSDPIQHVLRVFGILISGEIFCTRFVQEWITYR